MLDIPYEQSDISESLAYRHILKSIVKELKEKRQNLSLSDYMRSALLLPISGKTWSRYSALAFHDFHELLLENPQ